MMRPTLFFALFAAMILVSPLPAEDAQDCSLTTISAFRMDLGESGRVRIPVFLNHHPFKMLIDTGAYFSVASPTVADPLGIKIYKAEDFALVGWGGQMSNRFLEVQQFSMGKTGRETTKFMVLNTSDEFDGLIGADFLIYFDLDFDFAKARLNFISPKHCPGKVVYWTQGPYGAVPFSYLQHDIALKIVLDGKTVDAILDTGAATTVMSQERAIDLFGLDKKKAPEGLARDLFKQMSFGSVTVKSPAITLVSDDKSKLMGSGTKPSMILGMDVLRNLHFYISYKEEMIYVTPASQY